MRLQLPRQSACGHRSASISNFHALCLLGDVSVQIGPVDVDHHPQPPTPTAGLAEPCL